MSRKLNNKTSDDPPYSLVLLAMSYFYGLSWASLYLDFLFFFPFLGFIIYHALEVERSQVLRSIHLLFVAACALFYLILRNYLEADILWESSLYSGLAPFLLMISYFPVFSLFVFFLFKYVQYLRDQPYLIWRGAQEEEDRENKYSGEIDNSTEEGKIGSEERKEINVQSRNVFTGLKSKRWFFVVAASYVMVLSGAFNDGFTGFFLAMPYVFILLEQLVSNIFYRPWFSLMTAIFLLGSIYALKADRTDWWLVHPSIGEKYELKKDIYVARREGLDRNIIMDESYDAIERRKTTTPPQVMKRGTEIEVVGQIPVKTGFTVSYVPELIIYDRELLQKLEFEKSKPEESKVTSPFDSDDIKYFSGGHSYQKKGGFFQFLDILFLYLFYFPLTATIFGFYFTLLSEH